MRLGVLFYKCGVIMNKLDRLLRRVGYYDPVEALYIDNPYLGKTFHELLSMMLPEGQAPDDSSTDWDRWQFNAAMLNAVAGRKKTDILTQIHDNGSPGLDDAFDNVANTVPVRNDYTGVASEKYLLVNGSGVHVSNARGIYTPENTDFFLSAYDRLYGGDDND